MANTWRWHVWMYGSQQNASASPITDVSELEAMVTAGTAFKMKVAVTQFNPDFEFDGEVGKMAGGVKVGEFDRYCIFSMQCYPFNWNDTARIAAGKITEEQRWDELRRFEFLQMMGYDYTWIHFENYPNEPWIPEADKAMAVVYENHSTSPQGGRRTVEIDLSKREPEDDL